MMMKIISINIINKTCNIFKKRTNSKYKVTININTLLRIIKNKKKKLNKFYPHSNEIITTIISICIFTNNDYFQVIIMIFNF
jgi:hypothetical protein